MSKRIKINRIFLFLMVASSLFWCVALSASANSENPNSPLQETASENLIWTTLYSPSRDVGSTVGEWKFDNVNSTTPISFPNTYSGPDAAAIGSVTFEAAGGIYKGYAYIQTSYSYLQIAHDTLYDLPSTFTVEFWFRQRSDHDSTQNLVQKDYEGYNFRIYRRAWAGSSTDDGAIIAGFTSATDSGWKQVSNTNNPAHAVWHYVAYAKSATGHAYYIDGNLIDENLNMPDPAVANSYQSIQIGMDAVDTDIDELRISDFAKTAGNISAYYNSFKPVANAGADQNVYGGDAVSLNGSGSSVPTGTTVTYKWTQTSGTTVEISNDTSKNASFTAPTVGSGPLTFQLAVTNNAGQESTDTCIVNVQGTVAPGTYYVSPKGSDTNDGSAGSPWKTLHHALSQINAGGSGTYVLYVALGTYGVSGGELDEALVLSQSNVFIIGQKGSGPIIDGTGTQNWSKGIEITGSNVVLQNLYVTGFSDTDEEGISVMRGTANEIRFCTAHGNNFGIRVSNATSTIIRDCDIYGNTTHGIDIVSSSGTTVVQNQVHDNPHYGIRTESNSKISRNLIYDNTYGIYVEAVTGNTASPTIKNNVIYEVASGAMSCGIYSLAKYYSSTSTSVASPEIYHNTIDGGSISGIYMEKDTDTTSDPVIKYNIITNFGQYGIQNKETAPADPSIEYNDVWNNSVANYSGIEVISDTNISEDPLYGSYSLQAASPCINAIPSAGDPVTLDYPGFTRPRPGKATKDMGAYEYVADETVNYTLPGGTGLATDYRIFTVPLNLGTGANMLRAMEDVLGSYDPVHWRGFLFDGTSYREFNSSPFASHTIKPGMGFWIITTYTDEIPFTGAPAPDGVDYVMELDPGWHLIGLPWIDTSILLSTIKVTDGVNSYSIIGQPTEGQLTQKILWDFTGDGADSGYVKRTTAGFRLQNNKGYFFKVVADKPVRLIIPHPNTQAESAPVVDITPNQTDANEDDETPPPPPGAEPSADIKANGQDGPIVVTAGNPVSVSVSLAPGAWSGRNADWWVAAWTPPLNWYTYVYPEGWKSGIHTCVQMPLFAFTNPVDVLNMVLPVGNYIFYFAVDGNMDGTPDVTWLDSVEVNVR